MLEISLISARIGIMTDRPAPLSFSIVYETKNLESVDLKNIDRSLHSLARQDHPIQSANEFLLMQSDEVPQNTLRDILKRYPWIRVIQVPEDTGYYEMKAVLEF